MEGLWLILIVVFIQAALISTECDWRYYQHYEQKGCKPVLGENGCPIKFQCETNADDVEKRCLHNGKWYNEREAIQEPCESCRCSGDSVDGSFIECASVDCPDWEARNKTCYMGYKPGDCCPREICPQENKDNRKTCSHEGKVYAIGQFIETEDVCQTCLCTKDWTGTFGKECKVNCLSGIYAQKIRKGCLSIYSEKACCLTGMYCGSVKGTTPVPSPVKDTDGLCHYNEKYYKQGSTIYSMSDECFECSCTVPPDFTCLRKPCSR